MFITIPILNGWAARWTAAMGDFLWQSTLLVALAALVAWLLSRASPAVRYWLWQIVAIKLLLMPFWTFYIPLPTWVENRLPSRPAAIQSTASLAGESIPSAFQDPLPSNGPGTATAPHALSFWERCAAITWQAWLLAAWSAVVFWQLVRLLHQRVRLAHLLKQGIPADRNLAGLIAEVAGQLEIRHVPTAVSVAADCPLFVCGFLRPRLVLPEGLLASLDLSERRQVIFHELAHVKRRDLLWCWPVEIARMVYFFHPLVYWVAYQLRLERELCCDQLAMARSGHPPADYARTLVQVVSHASEPAAISSAAIAAGATGNEKTK
jgi:beta-lactamase regulating signal transducer with metallopeptidase domain